MQRTPPRPRLFTDAAITRKVFLEYNNGDIDVIRDITGAALDNESVALLNTPEVKARVVVRFSRKDPSNTLPVFEFFIEKFRIDHDEHEQIVEIRIEPWLYYKQDARDRSAPPVKVIPQGMATLFVQAVVRLITRHDGKNGAYEIRSNVRLDQLTGTITF